MENPFLKIKTKREVQNHRKELSWNKLCSICDAAEGEMKLLLYLGIYTGQRLGDCCRLSWDEVDLMRGWIITTPNKTHAKHDEPVHIAIHPSLRALLEETPTDHRSGFVLPNLASDYNTSRDRVTDRVQDLFTSCGVEIYQPGTGPGTGKRAVVQYGFHSLRHTAVTMLQEAGTPQAVVQLIVGHRTVAMTQRYTHVGQKALREAIDSLPQMRQGLAQSTDDTRDQGGDASCTTPEATIAEVIRLLDAAANKRKSEIILAITEAKRLLKGLEQ